MQTQRILIIEDEKPIADLLAYGLKQEGFIAYQAQSGADGLELCREVQPDLLLLDWMLPDCSGTDLCRMITQEYNIPIIMLTARSHIEDKVHGLEAGADDYITKPFDLREVLVHASGQSYAVSTGRPCPTATGYHAGICVFPPRR